ncbi:type II secretion system F family protein [bacterium]|jgi:type IV pilus assembly protein PilC|nr:type II secretion system F family protein [bacterium]
MRVFAYSYEESPGQYKRGKVKADTMGQAKAFLKKKKIFPKSLKEEKDSLLTRLFEEKTVENDDIVSFTQLFAGCLESGLTIKDSLTLLQKQVGSKILKDRLAEVISDIDAGSSISESFTKHTDIFPKFYPMLLKAGEASGNISKVLDYIGEYLERINNLKKELVGVFIYPGIVVCVGLGLLMVILSFVAPTFKTVFTESGVKLPGPTIALFGASDFLLKYNYILITFLTIIGVSYFFFQRSHKGKTHIHRFILNLPIFGPVLRDVSLLRLIKTFDVLANNEVPITQSLQVLEDSTTNFVIRDIITEIRKDVARGLPISGPLLKNKKYISPLISYSISMGEKSGNLGPTLTRVGVFIDREIGFSMKKLSAKISPMLTLGIGGMVLFIALAIYLPIFDMMGNV